MRILVISSCGVEDRFLIRALRAVYPETQVLYPAFEGPAPKSGAPSCFQRHFTELRSKLGRQYLKRRLFEGAASVPVLADRLKVSGYEINNDSTARLIEGLQPDVLICSNAPILKPRIYGIARKAALNVHYGILPEYRGNHTLFWALQRSDFEKVGISIHHLSERLDQGSLIARIFPALNPGDHEFSVLTKAVRTSTAVLLEYLAQIEVPVKAPESRQGGAGALYRSAQRSWREDFHYAFLWMLRRNRAAVQPERVERFF